MQRMLSGLFVLATFTALPVFAPSASAAIEYPWCAQYGDNHGGTNCGFVTLEQCRWTISGNGGFCVQNPFYSGPVDESPRANRKRPRR